MVSNESGHSESEFYYLEEETLNQMTPINIFPNFKKKTLKIIYMLFAGREVRIRKNCARGLEYGPRPQAEGRAQDQGHSFSQYGPT